MKIALLQTHTIPLGENKLEYYAEICSNSEVKLLLLGEYVINNFFKELCGFSKEMIKEQSDIHSKQLSELAKKYSLTIVAPMVEIVKNQAIKCAKVFFPDGTKKSFSQQVLIPYEHWNEAGFFANKKPKALQIPTFECEGVKFGLLFGFELHFDPFFVSAMKKSVDCILLPSVGTFDSKSRWREIIKTRAFLNSCYILRANRVGEYKDEKGVWDFYGDSLLANPSGEIESALAEKEELLIATIDMEYLKSAKEEWGFAKALK